MPRYAYIDQQRVKSHLVKARLIDANTKRVIYSTYYNPKYSDLVKLAMAELSQEASLAGYYIIDNITRRKDHAKRQR